MKRYFRYTIQWMRNETSEVSEIDIPEGATEEEIERIVIDEMWADIIGNNIEGWPVEISKEEYEDEA